MSSVWATEESVYIYVHSNISAAVNWLTNTALYNCISTTFRVKDVKLV
jgi:hypothetical protein